MQHIDIDEGHSRWLFRVGVLAVVLAVAAVAAFFLHLKFAGGSEETASYEPYTVGTMTLRAMVTSSGVAVAQSEAVLSFSRPGQLADILVNLGDEVKEGQPLMRLKADELQNAAATAQSALALTKLQLQKVEEGATDTDLAKAEYAVETAREALTRAQNDLKEALDPATDAKMTAAQQAVAAAEANLAAAQAKLDTLDKGASDADLAAADSAVTQAESKLSQAQRTIDNAESAKNSSQASFQSAVDAYCDIVEDATFVCDNESAQTTQYVRQVCQDVKTHDYEDALSTNQVDYLSACLDSPTNTSASLADTPTATPTSTPTALPFTGLQVATNFLLYANTSYETAVSTAENAADNVTMAQSSLDAANAALDQLNEGASDEDINAAEQGVTAAEAGLTASRAALQQLIDGATDTTVADLSAAVDRANADLMAAEVGRDELAAGATQTELAMQQEQVHAAELQLQQANIALSDATLDSPFDGIVSALPVKLGQVLNATIPAITILTPNTLIFELNISETELASIKVGQVGGVMFDAMPAKIYPVQVFAIGLSPEQNQGVIIYKAKCKILGSTDEPGVPNPAPGMNGSASLITEQRADVIAVPSAVVRSRGSEKVVELIKDDGKIELQPVTTGMSDGDNIEITSGLSVGDSIAVRSTAVAKAVSSTPLPMGIQ
jgi:HlyD family secretion protein